MGQRSPATNAKRERLNRARILQAGVELADAHGLDNLSMRKLATELGFEVMSLYNHVANKDDLLDGMVDLVAGEIAPPGALSQDGSWKDEMRASAVSAHDVLVHHNWAPPIWWKRGVGAARVGYMESILRCLREAGFSLELTYHAYHALTMHVVGFTLQQLSFDFDPDDIGALADEMLAKLPTDTFPYLAEHIEQHVRDEEEDEFEYVLDLLLDGIERLYAQQPTPN